MENQNKKQVKNLGFGLTKLPPDKRDFSLTKLGAILELPEEDFVVAKPLKIKDQGNSDMCVAYASCSVSEDQEGVILSPEFFFSQIKKKKGDWVSWGADLRTACKVAVEIGFLEQAFNPYKLGEKERNFIANWENWKNVNFEENAKKHRKKSYFRTDGAFDTFDNFRAALWANRAEKRSIKTGALWKSNWTGAMNGIIPKEGGSPQYPHAFKFYGQKKINNEWYLVAQLSNGEKIGNNGIFYFPREIVNKEFTFGDYMYIDIDPEEAKKIVWSKYMQILEKIKKVLKQFLNKKQLWMAKT